MKKTLILIAFLIAFFTPCPTVNALELSSFDLFPSETSGEGEETEGQVNILVEEQLLAINLTQFEQFLSDQQLETVFSGSFYSSVVKIMKGEFFSEGQTFLSGISSLFFSSVTGLVPTFITLLAVTILVSVLSNFTSDLLKSDMQNLLSFALALIVVAIATPAVLEVSSEVESGINSLSAQAEVAFPILITLVYSLGSTAGASCFSPLLYILSNVIIKGVSDFVFPIFMFVLGVNIISGVSQTLNFSPIADFCTTVTKYVLGITFTVFSATMALGGISAGSFDSVSYRTAKYAIASSVPVIGSYVRDGFDLILFSGVLVKNAVGVGFVLLAFAVALAPLAKLVCLSLLFKATDALCTAFAPKSLLSIYKSMSKSLSLLATAYIAVLFMYTIAVIMLMISTNILF
ncbi:MAG: hypothetical protein R3Y32_02880 [Bacillota bacterium]